ncbi:MAG TPA: hypothetical protein PLV46_05020 [Reyranella sp.]|uniref:hypothetical protein n=1 Tax=Reyranella sp. TaxID=1929291 RepID=UPI002CC63A9B|nr:hypothetical protein [Reyranella sp.]HQS14995.1 hypothetical protein [Reyranella sp.]HQT10804.1 hypothetical protein [Reyranella sp.]
MSINMEQSMTGFPNKRSEFQEKSAVSATVRARDMLCDLSGPRGWNDTRESWLSRGARRAGLSLRRARAIFYQEPIRLDADEYLAIERAHQNAHAAVATLQSLASDADLRPGQADAASGEGADGEGRQADREECPAADAAVRSR